MGHNCENDSHLKKRVAIGKMGRSCKNGLHLEKWVTLGKMAHT